MIKIITAQYLENHKIRLFFSDGAWGDFDASAMLEQSGSLLAPLRETGYFRGFFLELGALCWKNGLELSPASLHAKLEAAGALRREDLAA